MRTQNCTLSLKTRRRLEAQGYLGFTDAQLSEYQFGIRFAYYLCASIVLIGLLSTQVEVLIAAMVIALFATLPPYHPFDYLYNYGVRQMLHKPKLPPRTNQGRFACGIATVWVGGIIFLLQSGFELWAYIAGAVLLCVATLVSTMDICVPSMIYNSLFKRHDNRVHS